MIVFNSYFKIIRAYLPMILIYTGMFVFFAILGTTSNKTNVTDFNAVKPVVALTNNDKNTDLIKSFTKYLEKNAKISKINNDDNALRDALFFRDVDYILIIPENFTSDFMSNKDVTIETMKVPDSYKGTYSEMLLNRYLNIARIYVKSGMSEKELSKNVLIDLEESTKVNLESKSNASSLQNANLYYNFSNYTLLSLTILIIGMTMASFREKKLKWRNMSSPLPLSKINLQLALGNLCITLVLWLIYVLISLGLYTEAMFSINGLLLIINSLVFVVCALSLGFLFGNLIKNREATSSISNVLSLGSSFLCGAFIPQYLLGESVLKFSRIFPSYWFIKNNDLISSISKFTSKNITTILVNMFIVLAFALLFYIITQFATKKLIKHS